MNKIIYIIFFSIILADDNLLIDDAINSYIDLLEKNPNNYDVEYNIGNLNYYKNNFEEAINKYNQALKTKDTLLQSDIYYNLGNTHYNLGNYQKSKEYYQKSLIVNPTNDDARYNYEFVNKIIKQQQNQEQQDQNQDGEQNQEQQDQNQDGEQNQEQQDLNQDGEQNQEQQDQNQDGEQNQEQQDQNQDGEQNQEQQDQQENNKKNNVDKTMSPEKILEREEAEAILNSLKANEKNMMKRRYMSAKTIKVLKDW